MTDHLRVSTLKAQSHVSPEGSYKANAENGDPDKYNQLASMQTRAKRKSSRLKTKRSFPLYWSYMLIKSMYLANVALQFLLISYVFNFNYLFYGYQSVFDHLMKKPFMDNEYFPKRSMCHVQTISANKLQTAKYLCSLPLNLFNEIFYSVFWFWLCILAVLTASSVFYWALLAVTAYRKRHVKSVMSMQFKEEDHQSRCVSSVASFLDLFDNCPTFQASCPSITLAPT